MQIRLKSVAMAAVAAGTLSLAVIPIAGQQAPAPAGLSPSTAGVARMDGKPNLSGIWQAFNTANWDILAHEAQAAPRPGLQMGAWGAQPGGIGIVDGNELPYRPEALEKKRRNFENRMTVKVANDPSRYDSGDPELQCYRPGVPRANYMPFPFQIFQNREQIMIVYEYKWSVRWIYMDVKSEAPVDSWMGWSNGRWDGDTLVVDVTGMNEYTWFDRAGNFHSDTMTCDRALDAQRPEPSSLRSHHRRSEGLHAALEDELPDLSPPGAQSTARRIQLRAVRGRNDVRPAWALSSGTPEGQVSVGIGR